MESEIQKSLLVESKIQLRESRNPTKGWNLDSKFHRQKSRIEYLESEFTVWNPESKTVLNSHTQGLVVGSETCVKKIHILYIGPGIFCYFIMGL